MLDPKQRAELDQASSALSEMLPQLWRAMYLGLMFEGFTEAQSLELVKAYITATCKSN